MSRLIATGSDSVDVEIAVRLTTPHEGMTRMTMEAWVGGEHCAESDLAIIDVRAERVDGRTISGLERFVRWYDDSDQPQELYCDRIIDERKEGEA